MTEKKQWWRGGVFYQIYPRSFFDSGGDGIGDLAGIAGKLEYVAALGVDAIWISPFFKSPMADFGYDVADYRTVDPIFGTNEDFEKLLEKAHALGLKVIIDMVLSHTSDKHEWFVESRKSKDGAKADWYVWADPKPDGSPPNNWQSVFGGASWSFDTRRGQYYLHNFLSSQPDLNYYNPQVRQTALDNCRYWLDRGVDGFRLDAINFLMHDPTLRDNPARGGHDSQITQFRKKTPHNMQVHLHDISRPETLAFLEEFRALMDEYPGTMTLGEVGAEDAYRTAAEYSQGNRLLNTCYNTHFIGGQTEKIAPATLREPIEKFLAQPFDSWPSWAFSNHDVVRAATRWGRAQGYETDPAFAKLLIALLCSLRGTAFLYQGDELGLTEAAIPFEKLQDPWGKYLWPEWQGRDGCRTPMPWRGGAHNAGFSEAPQTWLPIPDEHRLLAVDRQEQDENSVLHFSRRFLKWRKSQPALIEGEISFLETGDDSVLCFMRAAATQSLLCIFNLSHQERTIPNPVKKTDKNTSNNETLTLPAFAALHTLAA